MTATSRGDAPHLEVDAFDARSGNALERLVFNHRALFVALCLIVTVVLGWRATGLVINAAFDRVIPQSHPYIANYFASRDKLGGQGNAVRIVVENRQGDIFAPAFLELTRQINDEIYLLPGVDRAWMKSIWMSAVRWTEVTEDGLRGGPVMPEDFNGSAASLERLRGQIRASGILGRLVGTDQRSIMIVVPLIEQDPQTGARFDYAAFSQRLNDLRTRYEAQGVVVRIVGFAELVGELMRGMRQVALYFGLAILVVTGIILSYTRCWRSTLLVVSCSVIAVVWQLGVVRWLGMQLDPYSILVPFLVLAIGVSHAAQKMNGIMQDVARGASKYVAARLTFRRLFVAGLTALMADAVGFAVLVVVDIPVIKDVAMTASIGVTLLAITNLLLLPVGLSYLGVSPHAARRSLQDEGADGQGRGMGRAWAWLSRCTQRKQAVGVLTVAAALTLLGGWGATRLKVGDLDPGAPELRPESRYNLDVAAINNSYSQSGDPFVVIVKTPEEGCSEFRALKRMEDLAWALKEVPGVEQTYSMADVVANITSGLSEGSPKWLSLSRNARLTGAASQAAMVDNPELVDRACTTVPLTAYLADHKAQTLSRVVEQVEAFGRKNNGPDAQFLLAAGSAGIEAVTNMVVQQAIFVMYAAVYGAVTLLCWLAFRSWRAVLVALIPLVMTSVLSKALMAALGIGLKVSTLPVIALGVGVGVDYALYLLSVQLHLQRTGASLQDAYRGSLMFTGKVVALVGVTLAAGVVLWAWSPIKLQADMGILLTFMLLWNMVGALLLIPALSHFLLNHEVRPSPTRVTRATPEAVGA